MSIEIVAGIGIAKGAAELSKKLYEFGKGIKDREMKQKFDEMLDELRTLKQQASELEDENRALREKARFNEENYEFRNPFYYDKNHPDRPLCAKCFAKRIAAPMSEQSQNGLRQCLVCSGFIRVADDRSEPNNFSYDPLANL